MKKLNKQVSIAFCFCLLLFLPVEHFGLIRLKRRGR